MNTVLSPERVTVDLSRVGNELCHTIDDLDRALCGMGHDGSPIHSWVEPVDGVCPVCGKRSCPVCDLLDDVDSWRYFESF